MMGRSELPYLSFPMPPLVMRSSSTRSTLGGAAAEAPVASGGGAAPGGQPPPEDALGLPSAAVVRQVEPAGPLGVRRVEEGRGIVRPGEGGRSELDAARARR